MMEVINNENAENVNASRATRMKILFWMNLLVKGF